MTQIISDSPASCIGADSQWEEFTSSQTELDFVSAQQVTHEWIQSLPPELKDAALFKFCKIVEAKPTLAESFTLNQVLYRTISGGTFTESAESTAKRTGHDRKTILKGLNQAVEQNILEENKRRGTSNEYRFKPIEEWLPQPVVLRVDTRSKKIIEFPSRLEVTEKKVLDEAQFPVRNQDDQIMDSNNVVVNKLLEQTTTEEVSIQGEDTPSNYWKYVGQGIPRVYLPPELDADTGMKIEAIHSATQEPRQFILKNAIDLLYNQLGEIPSFMSEELKPSPFQRADVVINGISTVSTIPDDVLQSLLDAGIHLTPIVLERLWLKYSDSFEDALAYTVAQDEAGKIKQSLAGFFRKSLEENWSFSQHKSQNEERKQVLSVNTPSITINEPSLEEMALIDDAIATGRAKDKYYGTLGWLVIENNGHAVPWRQFLTLVLEGLRSSL